MKWNFGFFRDSFNAFECRIVVEVTFRIIKTIFLNLITSLVGKDSKIESLVDNVSC